MKIARAILLYALAVVLLGALFAPWLYWFVQWLAAHVDAVSTWTRHPFRRIFNRSLMIVALLGLWPLLRTIGYRTASEIGYPRSPQWWRHLVIGLGLGISSLTVAALVSGRVVNWDLLTLALLGKLCATAIAVSVIEETFFRGGLQGGLQRGMHWVPALVIASVIYSALHFLKPGNVKILPADVTWTSGFMCLGQILERSFAREEVVFGFITLFLAGGILGWVFLKSGALYLSIGLHAGWVLANELVRALRGGMIIEDWRTWPVLVALGVIIWRWPPKCSNG